MIADEKINVLSIAGSDSSAGAGVQADLKTIMALGGYCVVSITSITAQNKKKVSKIYTLDSYLVIEQIKSVIQDFNIKGIKIGLITNHNLSKKISNPLLATYDTASRPIELKLTLPIFIIHKLLSRESTIFLSVLIIE